MIDKQLNEAFIGLPNDEDIIARMEARLNESLTISQDWRQYEVRENYALFEGNQWTTEGINTQTKNSQAIININRTAPILESICGFEIQNRLDINYLPRLHDEEQEGFASDIMNPAVKYIEQNAHAYMAYTLSFKDMLICGIGAVDVSINYDNNPDGECVIERLFPAFLFWDNAARAKNITDSDYVVRLKVMNQELIKEQYGADYFDSIYDAALDARILEFFNAVLAVKTLGVVYEYQWRQKEPFYRVKNPFMDLDFNDFPPEAAQLIQALMMDYAQRFEFDPQRDSLFSVEKMSQISDLKMMLEPAGIKIKSTKQHKFKYYRAIITGSKVVEKSENYSHTGFSIKFMTGQFSELTQSYYGLGRSCKEPQRLLNQAVADYVGFLQTIPKGGVEIERDAVDDINAFIDTYAKARHVTVYEPGGLAKSRPKITPPIPAGVLEMIQYADQQIMQVCGVTPELMGMMQSKEMNSSFMRQQIRQSLTPLAIYFDSKYYFLQQIAYLFTDVVRILADNNEGRLIKNVTGEGTEKFFPLTKSRIAAEYDITVDEMPSTPDQDNDTFQKLLDLQVTSMNSPSPVNFLPLAMQFAPFNSKIKEQVTEMMKPPPPPEPDPVQQALLESETNYKNASAEKLKVEAMRSQIEMQTKQAEAEFSPLRQAADIDYIEAKTISEHVKAGVAMHTPLHDKNRPERSANNTNKGNYDRAKQ
jgi:hypothetical protein